MHHILKCGGGFLVCDESDGTNVEGPRYERIIGGTHCYIARELETLLRTTGFSGVWIFRHKTKPWLAVLARK